MAKKKTAVEPPRIAVEQLVILPISKLVLCDRNPRIHSKTQIRQLVASLFEFGFVMPVLIDFDYNVIAGHGRILAAKEAGMTQVPCVMASELTEAQRMAYIIADNKLTENAAWNNAILADVLGGLKALSFPVEVTGFVLDLHGVAPAPLKIDGANPQDAFAADTEEYRAFEDKFTPKKTTDDCYTPPAVYEAAKSWAVKEYGLEGREIIRPFFPGGDYQSADYPEGCVVIDNPPFSILSEIVRWYRANGIDFFLFAPALTLFSTASGECNYLPCGVDVTYENGAHVNTSFITNLGESKVNSAPGLYAAVSAAVDTLAAEQRAELRKYAYPLELVTAAMVANFSKRGVPFSLAADEASFVRALDAQKETGAAIYGGGFLIAEKAAAEKAAAEKAAAEKAAAEKAAAEKAAATKWTLSERELEIVRGLDGGG